MARYSPQKLFRASSVSALSDASIYSAPTVGSGSSVIIKELFITNTTGSNVTLGLGMTDTGGEILGPQDSFFDSSSLGSWEAVAGCTVSLGTAGQLKVTSTGTAFSVSSGYYAVTPGQKYAFGGDASLNYGVAAQITLTCYWYRSISGLYHDGPNPGGLSNYYATSSLPAESDTNPALMSGSITAPTDGYYARINASSTGDANGNQHLLYDLVLSAGTTAPTSARVTSNDRVVPDQSFAPGLTVLDVSIPMFPGDVLTALASASGMNILGTGVVIS